MGARQGQGVVMVLLNGCQPRAGLRASHLALLLFPALGRCHNLARAILVGRMVEESADVVNEKGIQHFGNFFLVGKIQSPLEGNPTAC